jgi:hypothetical protein
MIGCERHLATLAVGVGDAQRVAVGDPRDVGDAGREHALVAGELFVHGVGDAVRRQPQIGRQHGQRLAAEVVALDHVPQLVAHVEAAVGQARGRAGHQRIGAAAAPLGVVGARGLVEVARRIDDAKDARALEVGAHDARDRLA